MLRKDPPKTLTGFSFELVYTFKCVRRYECANIKSEGRNREFRLPFVWLTLAFYLGLGLSHCIPTDKENCSPSSRLWTIVVQCVGVGDCPTGRDIPTDKENCKILPSIRRVSSTVPWMGMGVVILPTGRDIESVFNHD